MMTELGSGPSIYRVRGWLRDLGGRFDYQRRVWLVPDSQAWEARRIIEHGGPLHGSTIEPLLDVDGDWSEDDLLQPTVPLDPTPVGPKDLTLVCRKALALIADDLNIGVWNESEAELFEYARQRLEADGRDIASLSLAFQGLQKKWRKLCEQREAESLSALKN